MAQEPFPSQPRAHDVMIEAQPAPIQIDPARLCVLGIDMQNDFGAKGGMFDRAEIDIFMIQRAVVSTARVLTAARQALYGRAARRRRSASRTWVGPTGVQHATGERPWSMEHDGASWRQR
jgi:hypothetical protein